MGMTLQDILEREEIFLKHKDMNNKEKALEIALGTVGERTRNHPSNLLHIICVKDACIEMAQWKDEQFFKFLLWLNDFYVIRKFDDGEPMNYTELIDNFKSMEQQ